MVAPQIYIRILVHGTCDCVLIWEKNLCRCNGFKDLEVRSSWIIQVSPKSKDKCPQKRQTEQRREGCMKAEEEPGVMQPQAKGCMEPLEAGREGKDPPLEPLEGAQPHPLALGHLASITVRKEVAAV